MMEIPADRVGIDDAQARSQIVEFLLLRFGDAVVLPLCIKRISSITPPFSFGMLGAVFM